MKLEVGKKYLTRLGDTVTIVEDDGEGVYKYRAVIDDENEYYREDGRYIGDTRNHRLDLVGEYDE